MNINMNDFLTSLQVMGKGMAGIFMVTVVIVVTIILLNKACEKKGEE